MVQRKTRATYLLSTETIECTIPVVSEEFLQLVIIIDAQKPTDEHGLLMKNLKWSMKLHLWTYKNIDS